MAEPTIYIVDHRHYNIVWRKSLEEYADMQEWHLLKVVALMRNYPQYKFTISQAIVPANFIVRHRELESELRVRLGEGQIGVAGGCYVLPDTNMVSGEALYRNLLLGIDYFRKNFEYEVKVGSFEGASGCSAQLPQMLASLGVERVVSGCTDGLKLECEGGSPPPESPTAYVWEGLDGTQIPVYVPAVSAGPTRFYPEPFQETFRTKESFELLQTYRDLLAQADGVDAEAVWLHISDEERKIDDELIDAVWEERRNKDRKQMKFALPGDYIRAVAGEPVGCLHRGELNPVHTGTYATRIGLKQASVELENLAVEVEKWFTVAGTEGMHFPALKFHDIWEQIFVLQSHHAISGCHTDKVKHRLDSLVHHTRRDLAQLRKRAISSICAYINAPARDEWRPLHVFNSLNWRRKGVVEFSRRGGVQVADENGEPVPVLNREGTCHFLAEVPPCGYRTYWYVAGGGQHPREAAQRDFETDFFRVGVDDRGGLDVEDKRNNMRVTSGGEFWADVIAREDRGSLWCQGYTNERAGSTCTGVQVLRELLGWEVRRTGEIARAVARSGHANGEVGGCSGGVDGAPGGCSGGVDGASWGEFGSVKWTQSLLFYDSLPYFDLHLDLEWRGSATELRLRLPFASYAMSTVYGIPFGAIARMPYKADSVMQDGRSLVEGEDWPTSRWVEMGDGDYGITVAHNGIPGVACDGGAMEFALLRSPIDDPDYSHNFYLQAERGARENGRHQYRFSFLPGPGDWRVNSSYRLGYEFQNPLFAYAGPGREGRSAPERSFLDFGPGNLICTAWTADRRGRQLIRIIEAAGRKTALKWNREPRRSIYHASPFGERLDPAEHIIFEPFQIRHIILG